MANRHLFVPFTKVDEEKREVYGRLTQEVVDRDGEIWDYEASVPHMKAWSDSFAQATDGKSLGNLRAMHQPISAGKLIAIDFNDAEKAVDIGTKIVDDKEWEKVQEGLYTGFSLGGKVVKSWRDPNDSRFKRFEIKPIESSLADMPCVPTATFTYVKASGLTETRHFKKIKAESAMPTKFADQANKRLPIETKAQTNVSLAVWGKTQLREKYSADEQTAIVSALAAAAQEHGIELTSEKIAGGDYTKSLYDVSRLADLIQSLAWAQDSAASEREWEGDESTVPDQLRDVVASLLGILETMVGEEGDELLRMLGLDTAAEAAKTANVGDSAAAAAPAVATPTDVVPPVTEAAAVAPAADAAASNAPAVAEKIATPDTAKAHSKKHIAALQDLHDAAKVCMKMMSDHCERLAGMIADGAPADDDSDDASEKVAGAEFTKVVGERDDWQKRANEAIQRAESAEADRDRVTSEKAAVEKQADELAEYGEKLMAALETKKATLVTVDRSVDGVAAFTTESSQKTAEAGVTETPTTYDRNKTLGAFKKAFGRPQFTGVTIAR